MCQNKKTCCKGKKQVADFIIKTDVYMWKKTDYTIMFANVR